jgi:inositol transport system ATP-binding protein
VQRTAVVVGTHRAQRPTGWNCDRRPSVNPARSSHGFTLQVRGLSKSFPGVQALAGVQLNVAGGEVHALMGENGAGKSTLMKIVSGLDQPDAGEMLLQGRPAHFRSPHEALRQGIAMIHQELLPFSARPTKRSGRASP